MWIWMSRCTFGLLPIDRSAAVSGSVPDAAGSPECLDIRGWRVLLGDAPRVDEFAASGELVVGGDFLAIIRYVEAIWRAFDSPKPL